MSEEKQSWQNGIIKFSGFDTEPLDSIIDALQSVEDALQAIIDILQAFMIDVNPFSIGGIINAFIQAIKDFLEQITNSGLFILPIIPDMSRDDLQSIIESIHGGYDKFESKVVGKLLDEADINRPEFNTKMSVAMMVMYMGADYPYELIREIMALMQLLNVANKELFLPAPINVKVNQIKQSGDVVGSFKELFDSDDELNNSSLVVEWTMGSASANVEGAIINRVTSMISTYSYPNFLIERFESKKKTIVKLDSPGGTFVSKANESIKVYTENSNPLVTTKVSLREKDGSIFNVPNKVMFYDSSDGTSNIIDNITDSFKFTDSNLEPETSYYYRVRACFGDPSKYIEAVDDFNSGNDKAFDNYYKKTPANECILEFGGDFHMGRSSLMVDGKIVDAITKVPGSLSSDNDLYNQVHTVILAGAILGMDMQPYRQYDDDYLVKMKTGFGLLSSLHSDLQMLRGVEKYSYGFARSKLVSISVRKLANKIVESLINNYEFRNDVVYKLSEAFEIASTITHSNVSYMLFYDKTASVGIQNDVLLDEYLRLPLKDPFRVEYAQITSDKQIRLDFPIPLEHVSYESRQKIADAINQMMVLDSYNSGYLQWRSITVGDLFNTIVPFVMDLINYLDSLMHALKSILSKIIRLLENLKQKINDLKYIIEAIEAIIKMLVLDINVSLLTYSGDATNQDLVDIMRNSDNKPSLNSNNNCHSGIVFLAGGPGSGAVRAVETLAFLLTLGQMKPESGVNPQIDKLLESYDDTKEKIDETYDDIFEPDDISEDEEKNKKIIRGDIDKLSNL